MSRSCPTIICRDAPIPDPDPWLVGAVGLKLAAAGLANDAERATLMGSLNSTIQAFLDDVCGALPRPHGPVPGPNPWIFSLASELAVTAQSFAEGGMRTELLALSSRVLQMGVAQAAMSLEGAAVGSTAR